MAKQQLYIRKKRDSVLTAPNQIYNLPNGQRNDYINEQSLEYKFPVDYGSEEDELLNNFNTE